MIKLITALAVATLSTGCASIINDTSQPMRIDTVTADGTVVEGASCKVTNDYGSFEAKSGEQTMVRRSSNDLDIACKDPANPNASARAISRANMGLAGNIIFGGGIGAIIDHTRGTAYTYPTWIKMVFGQTLVFDRRLEKSGEALTGLDAATAASASAIAATDLPVPLRR